MVQDMVQVVVEQEEAVLIMVLLQQVQQVVIILRDTDSCGDSTALGGAHSVHSFENRPHVVVRVHGSVHPDVANLACTDIRAVRAVQGQLVGHPLARCVVGVPPPDERDHCWLPPVLRVAKHAIIQLEAKVHVFARSARFLSLSHGSRVRLSEAEGPGGAGVATEWRTNVYL